MDNGTPGPVCVDLFAGCGGLSEGLLSAGVDVAVSVELHPQPALTHAFNHPSTSVLVGDVRQLDFALLESELQARGRERIDVVVGGPPCQGFSSAGKKFLDDPRNALFKAYADVVAEFRPRMFLMENVPGFRSMFGGFTYRQALATFHDLGYQTVDHVVRAADFGVPQTRKRFILVGWLPDEVKPFELSTTARPYVTAADALADLDFLKPGEEATRYRAQEELSSFAEDRRGHNDLLFNHLATQHRARAVAMMSEIKEGRSIRDVDPSVRSAKRTMSRLDRGQLARTVLSLPDDMIHYKHHRILTVRESARLQTFDDDFVFFGKRTSGFTERRVDVPQYTQVGNAVPPLLGRALGQMLARSLGYGTPLRDLRDLSLRRENQRMVRGTSGWSGYSLDPACESDLRLRTVSGDHIALPVTLDDAPVMAQESLRRWSAADRPRRTQWAPGVVAKERPAWEAPTWAASEG